MVYMLGELSLKDRIYGALTSCCKTAGLGGGIRLQARPQPIRQREFKHGSRVVCPLAMHLWKQERHMMRPMNLTMNTRRAHLHVSVKSHQHFLSMSAKSDLQLHALHFGCNVAVFEANDDIHEVTQSSRHNNPAWVCARYVLTHPLASGEYVHKTPCRGAPFVRLDLGAKDSKYLSRTTDPRANQARCMLL